MGGNLSGPPYLLPEGGRRASGFSRAASEARGVAAGAQVRDVPNGGCVQRTSGVLHTWGSRCQWGLSPSVMVDCTMCLPLHECKEGA